MRKLLILILALILLFTLGEARDRRKKIDKTSASGTVTSEAGEKSGESSGGLKDKLQSLKEKQGATGRPVNMSPAQQQNVDKLLSDLNAITSGSQVSSQQMEKLKQDLMNMADGAVRPSQQSVEKLAEDLASAWSDGELSPREQKQLMEDFYAVMNSSNITAQELQAVIDDAQDIFKSSGVDKNDVKTIVGDLQAIGRELQKNANAAAENAGASGVASGKRKIRHGGK